MQMVRVTQKQREEERKFTFSNHVFSAYFVYITQYSDPDKKAMTLPEWMNSFIPESADTVDTGESIEEQKKRIIEEAEKNAEFVMRAFTAQ